MTEPRTISTSRLAAGVLGNSAIYFVALFAPVGTLRWWRGWVMFAAVALFHALSTWLVARVQRGLLAERAKLPIQKGQPLSDRVLLSTIMASLAGLVAFSSFDGFCGHWLPAPPLWVSALGLACYAAGSALVISALRTNAYAAMVVRHQAERSQAVVDTGPYAVVRHPMYTGVVVQMIALPLVLGSTAGLLAATVPIALLIIRIVFEERLLRRELADYAGYSVRVRHRLLPGIW